MEIGGEDLILKGPTSDEDWVLIFHEVKKRWPDAILERVGTGQAFLWKDQGARDQEFAPDEVPHGFLHVLMSPEDLTIVVDADESTTEASQLGRSVFESVRVARG